MFVSKILSKSLLCAFSILALSAPAYAESQTDTKLPFNEDQRAAMEDFVRNFILDNPEVLMESVNRFRMEEEKKKEEGSLKILKENMGFLNNGQHPEIGNPKGDILIVEFFDYNCGYCHRAMEVLQKAVENDKNLRVVFIEHPILSPQSLLAAKWAIAANKQGKYWAFHQEVMATKAPKDEENLAKMAEKVGLNVEKLKADVASKETEEYLASVQDFANKLMVTGTPAFIIGDQIIRGFMEYEAFKTIIEGERKNKS